MSNDVYLQRIAMVAPTEECIYAPSRTQTYKTINQSEFMEKYYENARVMGVSFEPDGKSNPQPTVACWYIQV